MDPALKIPITILDEILKELGIKMEATVPKWINSSHDLEHLYRRLAMDLMQEMIGEKLPLLTGRMPLTDGLIRLHISREFGFIGGAATLNTRIYDLADKARVDRQELRQIILQRIKDKMTQKFELQEGGNSNIRL